MEPLDQALENLKKVKASIKSSLRSLGVYEKHRSPKSKLDKMVKKETDRKIEKVRHSMSPEVAKTIGGIESFYCPDTEQAMVVSACLARLFIPGHPRHKVCEKCSRFNNRLDSIIDEINKKNEVEHEKENPLGFKLEDK